MAEPPIIQPFVLDTTEGTKNIVAFTQTVIANLQAISAQVQKTAADMSSLGDAMAKGGGGGGGGGAPPPPPPPPPPGDQGKIEAGAKLATEAIKGGTEAATEFLKVLDEFSVSGAVKFFDEMAEGAGRFVAALGPLGAAVGGLVVGLGAIAAAYGGLKIAEDALAVSAARDVIALNNLVSISGATIEQIISLRSAFTEAGGSANGLYQVMRNVAIRMQAEWPIIARAVRDSADNIESDIIRVREAMRSLETARLDAAATPVKVVEAQVGLRDAERGFAEQQREVQRNALAIEEAMLGQVRALERVHEAQRGVVEAQIESKNAQIGLQEARLNEQRSVYAVVDAQRAVTQAQNETKSAQLSLQSATESYEEAVYKYEVKHGERSRDIAYEQDLANKRELEHIQELKIARDAAQERLRAAPEAEAKARLGLQEAQLAGPKAAEATAQAALRLQAAGDKQIAAAVAVLDAEINQKQAALNLQSATAKFDASGDLLLRGGASIYMAARALIDAIHAQEASRDNVEKAQIDERKAERAQADNRLKDVLSVRESLYPEAGKRPALDVSLASPSELQQAIVLQGREKYGGGAMGTIKALSEAMSTHIADGIGQGLQRSIVGRLGPEDSQAFTQLMNRGPQALDKAVTDPNIRRLIDMVSKSETLKTAQETVGGFSGLKDAAEAVKDLVGMKLAPDAIANFKSLKSALDDLASDTAITTIVTGLHALTTALAVLGGVFLLSQSLNILKTGRDLLTRGGKPGAPGTVTPPIEGAPVTPTTTPTVPAEPAGLGGFAGFLMDIFLPAAVALSLSYAGGERQTITPAMRKRFGEYGASSAPEPSQPSTGRGALVEALSGGAGTTPSTTGFTPEQLTPVGPDLDRRASGSYFAEPPAPIQAREAAGAGGIPTTATPGIFSKLGELLEGWKAQGQISLEMMKAYGAAHPGAAAGAGASTDITAFKAALDAALKQAGVVPEAATAAGRQRETYTVPKEGRLGGTADVTVVRGPTPVAGSSAIDRNFDPARDGSTRFIQPVVAPLKESADKNKTTTEMFASATKMFNDGVTGFKTGIEAFAKMFGFDTQEAGHAAGGPVHGPGGPTDDLIPARLSAGEFVMQSRAVSHFGVPMMHAINSMRLPKGPIHFNFGGLVQHPGFGFAGSGMGSIFGSTQQHTLDLRTNAGTFRTQAGADVIRSISQSALHLNMSSSGIKPGWYR